MKFTEHDEQVRLMRTASFVPFRDGKVRDYLFAIPNGGTRGGKRAMLAALRKKAEGLTSGVPDLFCFVPMRDKCGLFIEMKRPDGVPSDVSDAQKKMMSRMSGAGYQCLVAFGCDQAWKGLCEYLEIK